MRGAPLTSTLVLGIAFGARATQVEVRDAATGALVADGAARHGDGEGGPSPMDPTTWWRSLTQAVAATGERDIAALAVSGGHPGLVLLDGAGAVLRPMQPWPDDAVAEEARGLRERLGDQTWARETGALPGPTSAASRLAWLRRHDPTSFTALGAALLPHDWLTYRLSGRRVTDRGSASLSGLWSPRHGDWSDEARRAVVPAARPADWAARLPDVVGPGEPADWLTAPVFELLGLRGRPLVAPGTGEPMAIALALGLEPGDQAVVLGAGTTALTGLDHPVTDGSGVVRSRADASGGHLAVTALGGGRGLLHTVADLLQVDLDDLGSLALSAVPGSTSPVVVPWSPGRSSAAVLDLATGTSRAQMAHAVLEGLAAGALEALDLVGALDGARARAGGPLHLVASDAPVRACAQVLADLAGVPVVAAPSGSMAAAGACVQAAAVLQGDDPTTVARRWQVGAGAVLEPREAGDRDERRRRHREERARQIRALSG